MINASSSCKVVGANEAFSWGYIELFLGSNSRPIQSLLAWEPVRDDMVDGANGADIEQKASSNLKSRFHLSIYLLLYAKLMLLLCFDARLAIYKWMAHLANTNIRLRLLFLIMILLLREFGRATQSSSKGRCFYCSFLLLMIMVLMMMMMTVSYSQGSSKLWQNKIPCELAGWLARERARRLDESDIDQVCVWVSSNSAGFIGKAAR